MHKRLQPNSMHVHATARAHCWLISLVKQLQLQLMLGQPATNEANTVLSVDFFVLWMREHCWQHVACS